LDSVNVSAPFPFKIGFVPHPSTRTSAEKNNVMSNNPMALGDSKRTVSWDKGDDVRRGSQIEILEVSRRFG
jgi:hypothetical protein